MHRGVLRSQISVKCTAAAKASRASTHRGNAQKATSFEIPGDSGIGLTWYTLGLNPDEVVHLCAPRSENEVLDYHIAASASQQRHAQAAQDPYWGIVWPASVGLAEFIIQRPQLVRDRSVAELGCGLSLTGIVAAKACHARHVMLCDKQPHPLFCATQSAKAAGLSIATSYLTNDNELRKMFEPVDEQHLANDSCDFDISLWVSDWLSESIEAPPFQSDVVLASDVLYERRMVHAFAIVAPLFAHEEILVSDPMHRNPEHRELLKEQLAGVANVVEETDMVASSPPSPESTNETNVRATCELKVIRFHVHK